MFLAIATGSLRTAGLANIVVAFRTSVHEQSDADFAKADIAEIRVVTAVSSKPWC